MSVVLELNRVSLDLRKSRDELAGSLSVVVSSANQIAKDRSADKGSYTVTDDDAIQAIRRSIKQLEDTIGLLSADPEGNLYKRSVRELAILKSLLPQGPTEKDIKRFVQDYFVYSGIEPNIKSMGPIMKSLAEQYGSTLDRSMASQVIKNELAGL